MSKGSNLCARICVGAESCFSERFFHICRKRKAPRLFSSAASFLDLHLHLALHPLERGSQQLLGSTPHPTETTGTGFISVLERSCSVLVLTVTFGWVWCLYLPWTLAYPDGSCWVLPLHLTPSCKPWEVESPVHELMDWTAWLWFHRD